MHRTVDEAEVRWPRGLTLIGLAALLVSAWGGLVAYLGPDIGFHANAAPAWQWSDLHTWLYLVPGAVGVVAGLAVMAHAGRGSVWHRVSLWWWGLVLGAVGAWFVLGPSAWPVVNHGVVFGPHHTAMGMFLAMLGYNLGVGVVVVLLGGMALKASLGEYLATSMVAATYEPTAATYEPTAPAAQPVAPVAGPAPAIVEPGATGPDPAAQPVVVASPPVSADPEGPAPVVSPMGDTLEGQETGRRHRRGRHGLRL